MCIRDRICTMDYDKMLQYHKEKGADCTISVLNVTYEEAKRFGIMNTDEDERIYEFEEKPAEPKSTKASMGIYIFKWKLIRQYLIDDGNDPESEHDFGKNIIPRMLEDGRKMYAYSFDGYWRDVGTIDSLWEANMELLDENPQIDLNDDKMRIYTRNFSLPPHYIAPGASVKNSILADGCVIEGEVENCVIHSGVKIGKGSVVKNSVIMKDVYKRQKWCRENNICWKTCSITKRTRKKSITGSCGYIPCWSDRTAQRMVKSCWG